MTAVRPFGATELDRSVHRWRGGAGDPAALFTLRELVLIARKSADTPP